jgi:hypothetical protein
MQSRLDALRQRRDMAAYDVERALAARQPENPWRERMELLDRSLATIEDDLQALDATVPLPPIPLPETPITDMEVRLEEPVSVTFTIGSERFRWEEEIDWDQRGGPVVRGQILQRSGNAYALVPPEVPIERRGELERHLAESASVFALDLRDRALEGEPLPEGATLADLARPCPVCGDWLDWRGHCDTCAPTAARHCAPKRRAWPRSGTTRRKTATSGRNDSRSHASAWPISTRTLPASKPAKPVTQRYIIRGTVT